MGPKNFQSPPFLLIFMKFQSLKVKIWLLDLFWHAYQVIYQNLSFSTVFQKVFDQQFLTFITVIQHFLHELWVVITIQKSESLGSLICFFLVDLGLVIKTSSSDIIIFLIWWFHTALLNWAKNLYSMSLHWNSNCLLPYQSTTALLT